MSPPPDVTAVILCGGAGERMQGADKPLRPLLGRPLIERTLDSLRPQVRDVVLVANRAHGDYGAYAVKVVDDGALRGRGPLAGVAAGMAAASTGWIVSVPGDAPLLPGDLVARLERALARERAELAMVHDGRGRQPLCALLPRRLLPELLGFLAGGDSAPRQWQRRYRCAEADCSDWPEWAWSVNTPEEWELAEARLRQRGEGA
ncbi:MAG TPA: molybdenum cofactor guanylyltransferase MobA [Nevskia sp.]|nr:molybdenum cofactor guanylyltransferase MobA [Nevskia sp.]